MRELTPRTIAVRAALAVCLALPGFSACNGSDDPTAGAPPELRASLKARVVYPVKREEWRTDITRHTDSTMTPQVFRASQTTVALLQASPSRISVFELHGHGELLSMRPARIDPTLNAEVPRDLVAPTELSRPTNEGQVDIIDSARSILMRESIGGFVFKRDLPMLRGGSGRLCTVTPSTLLHLRVLGERRALEAFTLTALASEDSLVGRHRLAEALGPRPRFGSGDVRRCLVLTERDVLVVSVPDGPGPTVTPRVTRLRAPGSAAPAVIDSMARIGSAGNPRRGIPALQPIVVDAAIVDGGFVVLVGITSDRFGRLLDYYDERGEYMESAWLPFTAAAMTGAGPRFVLLHQDARRHWWMSSWLTPMAAHGAEAPPEPRGVTRAPEKQLFEPQSRVKSP